MLYIIGGVEFDLYPLNAEQVDHRTTADFAKHAVIGARESYEYVGPGDETLQFSGTVWPQRIGGLSELEHVDSMRDSGEAVLVMRGDGLNLRWFVIVDFQRKHQHLSQDGVGQKIDVTINLERAERPSSGQSGMALLTRLFG